jgi:putative exosortase-associated protein (TIGR04073 family)
MNERTSRGVAAALGIAALVGLSTPVKAEETAKTQCPICSKASDQSATYSTKAGTTLVRGAANTALGWTELISQPVQEVKSGGNVFVGIGKGVGQTVKRTLSGLGEVLTFWTPKVKDRYIEFATDCPVCMKRRQSQP